MMFNLVAVLVILPFVSCALLTSIDDFKFDNNNRLSSHYLLYHGNGCQNMNTLELDFREVHEIDHSLNQIYFGSELKTTNEEEFCNMVCLDRGLQYDHIKYPTPNLKYQNSRESIEWVVNTCQMVEIGWISYLDYDATVYWIDHAGNRVDVGTIQPGERNTFWISSFLGHEFDIINNGNEQDIHHYVVKYNSIHGIGNYTSGIMVRDVHREVRSTFDSEWFRAHQVKRTFTPFGFNKGKLPIDLFASMSAYYYNNQYAATVEEWEQKGVFVNWWEKDVFFISMPFKLKRYWQSRLKDLVEAWVGVSLELTDIYGMRRYEEGARLLTHVDRVNTHACSLIINVAQSDMKEPWPIEIYDHGDRLHEIYMEEGDIVFYESARCLHGRMQPLRGKHYVNLFAHYRPTGDPNWYMKENPEDAPKPVLDIGHCHSNGTKATCDGHYSVPYLSPKLENLHGGKDLYDFWVKTGQPSYSSTTHSNHQTVETEL